MPRRKKQITVEDEEPLARLPETPDGTALVSPTDERRQRELEDVLEEIGQDGRIKIWHVIDGKATYGGEMTMDGFTLDALFDNYGGGDKTLVFYQGRKRVDTLRVSLDQSVPPTNPREKKMAEMQAKNGGNGGTGLGDMSSFLMAMAQSQMSSMDMFSKMMLMQQQGNATMMQAVTTMLTARPEKDPTETALRIAEVLRPASPANDALTTFREALKMGMDIAGTGGDGDGTTELIGKGLEVVGHAISAARTPAALPAPVATPAQVRQIPPTPNGTSSVAEPPTPPQPTQPLPVDMTPLPSDRLWVRQTRPLVPMLATAVQFLSGDSAAVELLRRSSDDVIDDLMSDLDDPTPPGFLGRVQALFPAFRPSPEWAQQFIDALRDGVEEDDGDGDESDTVLPGEAPKVNAKVAADRRSTPRMPPTDPVR